MKWMAGITKLNAENLNAIEDTIVKLDDITASLSEGELERYYNILKDIPISTLIRARMLSDSLDPTFLLNSKGFWINPVTEMAPLPQPFTDISGERLTDINNETLE